MDFAVFLILLPYLLRVLGVIAGAGISLFLIWRYWNEVKFGWTRFWYWLPMPVIGATRRLSRNLSLREDGWFSSEVLLCSKFRTHLERLVSDSGRYDNAKSYLAKVHEGGTRRPMGAGAWLLTIFLVFIEATGFSLVLADYAIPGISEALRVPVALGLGSLLSIALVFFTHMAGRESHRRQLINKARAMWNDDEDSQRKKLTANSNQVTIEDDNADNGEKPYKQIINRVDTDGTARAGGPGWTISALILVIGVAIGAFFVREAALEQQNVCATLGVSPSPSYFQGLGTQPAMPPVITEQQKKNEEIGQNQQCAAIWRGSVITYVILGLVFVAVQLIGWTAGKSYGFAGVHSYAAWKKWVRFGTKKEYIAWHQYRRNKIKSIAQSHLSSLQRLLGKSVEEAGRLPEEKSAISQSGRRTFDLFLKNWKDEDDDEDGRPASDTERQQSADVGESGSDSHVVTEAPK